jgi:hypothetical protein
MNTEESYISNLVASLTPAQQALLRKALAEQASSGQPSSGTLDELQAITFERRRPPLDEFFYGKDFLALPPNSVFKSIMDVCWAADRSDVREVFVAAGKGSGKSTMVSLLMARGADDLHNHIRDPSAYFQLLPDSKIAIVNMSVGAKQAQDVMFNKFSALLNNAPCFHRDGQRVYEKSKRQIYFARKNFWALSGHSGYQAYFGYDVFFGCIDEMSHLRDSDDNPVAEEIYQGLVSSGRTRFKDHYKLLAISSPAAEDDALMKRVLDTKRFGKQVIGINVDGDADASLMKVG